MSESSQPVTIQALARAVTQALAMLAAMELDVFTPLRDGPLTVQQLADALGLRADLLQPLLRVLASSGLLNAANGQFANTPESNRFLVKWQPSYMGSVWLLWSDMWTAELKTSQSIRTGVPQARHDFATMSRAALLNFLVGSESGARSAANLLMQVRDLSVFRNLADVGGGLGGLALRILEACSELQVTVVELPAIAPVVQDFLSAAAEKDRADAPYPRVVAADVTGDDLQGPYDVAVCNRFLQVLTLEDAGRALKNIAQALEPNGTLYIIGHVLDDGGLTPAAAVNFGLLALNLYDGGQAFTEQQHRQWLGDAGFVDITREMLPNGYSLLSARKAA